MFKKKLLISLVIVLCIAVSVLACACDVHVHNFSSYVQTAEGHYKVCSCGKQTKLEEHDIVHDSALAPTCTEKGKTAGAHCGVCGYVISQSQDVEATGHNFVFGDDYFSFVKCQNEGCDAVARKQSENTYKDVIVYDFGESDKTDIENALADVKETLAKEYSEKTSNELHERFEHFDELISRCIEQDQIAYVFYCVYDGDASWQAKYQDVSDYYASIAEKYYSVFPLIDDTLFESPFKTYFEITDDEFDYCVDQASLHSTEYTALEKEKNQIEITFRSLSSATVESMPYLYEDFVEVENAIASLNGYDNYMDYAYKKIYGRDYTPSDVAKARAFIKEYLAEFYNVYSLLYYVFDVESLTEKDIECYLALTDESVMDSEIATEFIADYLKQMNSNDLNFFEQVNALFRDGNYFVGDYEGAFADYLSFSALPLMYLGPDSYSSSFSFIHEFGHYCNFGLNRDADCSFDLAEIHSQGNEMLFLNYLKDRLADYSPNTVEMLEIDRLSDAFTYVCLTMAVDEFEQYVYTGKSEIDSFTQDGKTYNFADGIAPEEYDALFNAVLDSYGFEPSTYWRYVVIESPAYYVSYSMSLITCLELYVDGAINGDNAKAEYFALFDYVDEEGNVTDYLKVLENAGLSSPFEEQLYVNIKDYLSNSLQQKYGK